MQRTTKADASRIEDEMKDWPRLSPNGMRIFRITLIAMQLVAAIVVLCTAKNKLGFYSGAIGGLCALGQIWMFKRRL